MSEFWEESFKEKQEMWGWTAADSAVLTVDLFKKADLLSILIPGFGYGRNAKVFMDSGLQVEGIEISKHPIEIAKKQLGQNIDVYHGGVGSMPFNDKSYDGIFCYALIHLLDEAERKKLISDCFNQLSPGGLMVFVTLSKKDPRYGQGEEIGTDLFKTRHGVTLFFYDADAIESEFSNFGLSTAEVLSEPIKDLPGKPGQQFWYIVCKKP